MRREERVKGGGSMSYAARRLPRTRHARRRAGKQGQNVASLQARVTRLSLPSQALSGIIQTDRPAWKESGCLLNTIIPPFPKGPHHS